MKGERLSPRQLAALRHLAVCCEQREALLPLWRRGFVEMWFRQPPSELPASRGPFFGVTNAGARLISAVFHCDYRGAAA